MSGRFFCDEPITGDEATLAGPEAHHLLHVRRAAPGQEVTLFDGSGQEFSARVVECGRREVRLAIESARHVSRELDVAITLGVALPKGERQRWLVEKAAELGVAAVVPLETERGVAQPTTRAAERLGRAVIEASKQCGRTTLMRIAEPVGVQAYFAEWQREPDRDGLAICAHPGGAPLASILDGEAQHARLAIGPEGGFTDEEVRRARDCEWTIAGLGARILRVETAAVALAAAISICGDSTS